MSLLLHLVFTGSPKPSEMPTIQPRANARSSEGRLIETETEPLIVLRVFRWLLLLSAVTTMQLQPQSGTSCAT